MTASEAVHSRLTSALVAVAGPAALGAVLGVRPALRSGLWPLAGKAVALPAVWLGVAALMLPALYVGTAFFRLTASPRRVAEALGRGLRAAGLALLAVTPAVAFVLATASTDLPAVVLGCLAVGGAAAACLRALVRALVDEIDYPALLFLVAWSIVALGLGALLFLRHVVA